MANIKSAEKRNRQAGKKRARNRRRISRLRSAVKKYRALDKKKRSESLPATHSEIDRALAKGAIHKNASARYKSRLAKSAAAK